MPWFPEMFEVRDAYRARRRCPVSVITTPPTRARRRVPDPDRGGGGAGAGVLDLYGRRPYAAVAMGNDLRETKRQVRQAIRAAESETRELAKERKRGQAAARERSRREEGLQRHRERRCLWTPPFGHVFGSENGTRRCKICGATETQASTVIRRIGGVLLLGGFGTVIAEWWPGLIVVFIGFGVLAFSGFVASEIE